MNRSLRDTLVPLLGRMPAAADPAVEIRPRDRIGDVERFFISYNLAAGERVTSYLLRPADGGESLPGILAIHQHAGKFALGKSEPAGDSANAMYHYGLELAQRGFAVLCPDLLAFEDRRPPEWRRRETGTDDMSYERFEAMRAIAAGSSLTARNMHDCAVALDVLQSLDGVDGKRLGVIGHSMGGITTNYFALFEPRVKAAVSSCGTALLSAIFRDLINHCFTLYWPGLLGVCDTDGLLADLAPLPYFTSSGDADRIFPIDSVRSIHSKVADAYREAGAADCFRPVIFEGGHGFPDDVRRSAYDFLDEHLKGR